MIYFFSNVPKTAFATFESNPLPPREKYPTRKARAAVIGVECWLDACPSIPPSSSVRTTQAYTPPIIGTKNRQYRRSRCHLHFAAECTSHLMEKVVPPKQPTANVMSRRKLIFKTGGLGPPPKDNASDWSAIPRNRPLTAAETTNIAARQYDSLFMHLRASGEYRLFQSPGFLPSVYSAGFAGTAKPSASGRLSPPDVSASSLEGANKAVTPRERLGLSFEHYRDARASDSSTRPCNLPDRQSRAEGIATRHVPHSRQNIPLRLRPMPNTHH